MRMVREMPVMTALRPSTEPCASMDSDCAAPQRATAASIMPMARSDSALRVSDCALLCACMERSPDSFCGLDTSHWLNTASISSTTAPPSVSRNSAGWMR